MQRRDVPTLVFGILITAVAACRTASGPAITTNSPAPIAAEPLAVSDAPAGAPQPDATAAPHPISDDRQLLGEAEAGLSLAVPLDWVDLTAQLDTPAMGNRLGIDLLFAADSARTGRSLLAGKSFADGAYVSALMVTLPHAAGDPAAALVELLTAAAPAAVRLSPVTPIHSANGVAGHAVDVAGGAIGLNVPGINDLRTRVALFSPATGEPDAPPWIVLLLSASAARWERQGELFERMLQSAEVYPLRPGAPAQAGQVILRDEMVGEQESARAALEPGVRDLWRFSSSGHDYASLLLEPEDPRLDLTLALIGPDGREVARIDNGFAGAMEAAADLPLDQPGVYIIEVSDFLHNSGGYTLSLELSDQPRGDAGGRIAFGQALLGQFPAGGRRYWVFTAAAHQHVNIVVEPGAPAVDPILELYGPGNRQLVELNEGAGGDPEVLSGYELPAAGEYAVVVGNASPQGGPYTLSLDEGGHPISNFYPAGDLAYGEARRESLQPQEAHAWFLRGNAGDLVLIRVTPLSDTLDPEVWLLDGAVERVAAADAFAAGEPETMELTLPAGGEYVLLVRDFNGEPGEYEVALGAAPAATPESAGALVYGDAILGTIRAGAPAAWSFEAEAGDVIDVVVRAADARSDLVLQLQGPDGATAVEADGRSAGDGEAIRAFVVPVSGQWRVVLREFFGDGADYQLSLRRAIR